MSEGLSFPFTKRSGLVAKACLSEAGLSDGSPWVQVQFTDPGGATLGSAVAVLSGSWYQSGSTPTAIV